MKALPVVIATLVLASPAAAAPFLRAKPLEPAASYVAGKPVVVWCARTDAAWHSFLAARGDQADSNGWTARAGADATYIDNEACSILLNPRDETLARVGAAAEILTHESIHMRGESDEGVTDCAAMHEVPGVLTRFFGIKSGTQLRSLMASVWLLHRQEPAAYRSVC